MVMKIDKSSGNGCLLLILFLLTLCYVIDITDQFRCYVCLRITVSVECLCAVRHAWVARWATEVGERCSSDIQCRINQSTLVPGPT